MVWLTGTWSEIYFVTNQDERRWGESCRALPGIYRLIALQRPGLLDPEPLNRVCGVDQTGTIYIGKSENLSYRVGLMVMQHRPDYKTKKHMPLTRKMGEVFGPARLAVYWEYVPEGVIPRERESELMRVYQDTFGEMPPLNFQG